MFDDRMSAVRVRQLAARKRAIVRTRTYVWIGLVLLVVLMARSGAVVWDLGTAGAWGDWRLPVFAGLAGVSAWGAVRLWREARKLTAMLAPAPEPALPPPDFGPLSDGSQQWKNLERVEE